MCDASEPLHEVGARNIIKVELLSSVEVLYFAYVVSKFIRNEERTS